MTSPSNISGSQRLIVGDPWNRIIHNYAINKSLFYYYNIGFGDPKVSACDPHYSIESLDVS
jgi:hypothetical protein